MLRTARVTLKYLAITLLLTAVVGAVIWLSGKHDRSTGLPPALADAGLAQLSAAALATLDTLPVKGKAPMTGYSRRQFGDAWTDDNNDEFGHNGCDTRDDILARDLTDVVRKGRCKVASGTLQDPYTGKTIEFQRGPVTSRLVQIDHVVALGDAWVTGAQQLSMQQRIDLANDPRNLLAVDGQANENKRDYDAATWLPPNKSFRCTYVAIQITVKSVYQLWVTSVEKDAMTRLLSLCAQQP